MPAYLKSYIAELKALTEADNRRRTAEAAASRKHLRSALGNLTPLTEQIEDLMASLPQAQRERDWAMADLVGRLQGRYRDRPHAANVGQALRALGWVQQRDWSAAGGGRRVWLVKSRPIATPSRD